MNNIFLYVGDNAQGKTRKLVSLMNQYRSDYRIVTNIEKYSESYIPDKEKLDYFKEHIYNDVCKYLVIETQPTNSYEMDCRRLVELLYSSGDILILDELDACLTRQEILDISDCISQISHLWKEIHVTGYSIELLRMFTKIDNENETYDENVYLVKNNLEPVNLTEEETYEYFDSIRG